MSSRALKACQTRGLIKSCVTVSKQHKYKMEIPLFFLSFFLIDPLDTNLLDVVWLRSRIRLR